MILVPLTYDEAAAYLRYLSADPLAVFDFTVATNHLLNTVLAKLFSALAGDSELVLRLPSLLGYGLYLGFSVLILRTLTHRPIAYAGFLLLNLNPYLLDYFSLSRGYGLSLGLLVGALFFFFRFLTDLQSGSADCRHASRALVLASAAVLANFAVLNVYLALVLVGFVAFAMFERSVGAPARTQETRRSRMRILGYALVAAVYTLLVFSRDLDLSERLYEPVTVRIAAHAGRSIEPLAVFRIDHRGRAEPLLRHDGDLWQLDRPTHFHRLRIELPAAQADSLASIEVAAGNHLFRYDRAVQALWSLTDSGPGRRLESNASLSLPQSRMPAFRGIMNWRGDSQFAASLAVRAAVVMGALAGVSLLLMGAGWIATRQRLVSVDGWRVLSSSALWTAALAGPPLYLLRRNGELYYGGIDSLVQDTFYSIIHGSFYGRSYHADQTPVVFGAVLMTIVVFGVVVGISVRRRTLTGVLPGLSLVAIMTIVSIAVVAQRLLFDTPYLLGRTALFYIPLYLMFLAFASDALAALGRLGTLVAWLFVAAPLTFSLFHFYSTANVKYTFDWRQDAATKIMIGDVVELAGTRRPHASRVSLGVDWMYYPVAVFYAERARVPIDVHVIPAAGGSDFLYVEDARGEHPGQVVRRYTIARSLLVRPEQRR